MQGEWGFKALKQMVKALFRQARYDEMMKRYQVARKEIIADRDRQTNEVKYGKYITNSNYVYEPLGKDDDKIKRLKDDGLF